ncbi:HHAT family protein [Megaselia abdita]
MRLEVFLYFLVYLLFLLHGIYQIVSIRGEIWTLRKYNFAPAIWKLPPRDHFNDELENFKSFVLRNIGWYLLHLVSSSVVRHFNKNIVPFVHALVGFVFILYSYNVFVVFVLSTKLISFFLASRLNSKSSKWFLAAVWMTVIYYFKTKQETDNSYLNYEQYYEVYNIFSWSVLKCLSFSLDTTSKRKDWLNFLGYTLYFPTIIFGPFFLYKRYSDDKMYNSLKERTTNLIKELVKLFLIMGAVHMSLSFLYINYMQIDFDAVLLLRNQFGLYGFGYFMGQYFHLHYYITYGTGLAFGKFDDIKTPPKPQCVGRIYFYSDMWKFFDPGLYEFLFIHIYASSCGKNSPPYKKILAVLATFAFVYVWHGLVFYIFLWAVFNMLCLSLEKALKAVLASEWYQRTVVRNLSPSNQMRLFCILGTQIFMPSAIANFYFFGGEEIGTHFLKSTYTTGIIHYIFTSFICYCIFSVAVFITDIVDEKSGRKHKTWIKN